jgi:hypothetical protein
LRRREPGVFLGEVKLHLAYGFFSSFFSLLEVTRQILFVLAATPPKTDILNRVEKHLKTKIELVRLNKANRLRRWFNYFCLHMNGLLS